MKNKVTSKVIRKAVKELRKVRLKPDEDGLIEVEDPTIRTDFLYLKKIKNKGGNDENNSLQIIFNWSR